MSYSRLLGLGFERGVRAPQAWNGRGSCNLVIKILFRCRIFVGVGEDGGKLEALREPSCTVGGNAHWCGHCGKQ